MFGMWRPGLSTAARFVCSESIPALQSILLRSSIGCVPRAPSNVCCNGRHNYTGASPPQGKTSPKPPCLPASGEPVKALRRLTKAPNPTPVGWAKACGHDAENKVQKLRIDRRVAAKSMRCGMQRIGFGELRNHSPRGSARRIAAATSGGRTGTPVRLSLPRRLEHEPQHGVGYERGSSVARPRYPGDADRLHQRSHLLLSRACRRGARFRGRREDLLPDQRAPYLRRDNLRGRWRRLL